MASTQAGPGIGERRLGAAEVGRRVHPGPARCRAHVMPRAPARHRHDAHDAGPRPPRVREARHLPEREAVDERPRRHRDQAERHRRVPHRPLDALAAQRVGPVEHDHLDARLGGGLEAEQHRARVGVEADTRVLQVDDERVEPAQVFRRRACLRSPYRLTTGRPLAGVRLRPRPSPPRPRARAARARGRRAARRRTPAPRSTSIAWRPSAHRRGVAQEPDAAAAQRRALVERRPARGRPSTPRAARQTRRAPASGAAAAPRKARRLTAARARARPRRPPAPAPPRIMLFSRVGCTRFVSRIT